METTRRPRGCWPASTPTGSGVCLDLAPPGRAPGRSRRMRWPRAGRRRPARGEGPGVRALRGRGPGRGAAAAARLRRAALPAPDPRAPAPASARPTTSTRRSTRGLPGGRGGCTTTCRCTPRPSRRCHHRAGAARGARASWSAGPTPVCDHLDVETYTWGVLPPAQRPPDRRAARRRHRRRAGLRPRQLTGARRSETVEAP